MRTGTLRSHNKISTKHKINKFLRGAALFILFGVGIFFAFDLDGVLAKYIESTQSKDIINANSFYFTSDYLSPEAYDGSVAEYIMAGWDGKSKKSFMFNVRNYDNPLLFNDKEQDVKYEMEYKVLNGDDRYVNVYVYKLVDGREVEELSGVLKGSEDVYSANRYKLSVVSKNQSSVITHDISVLLTVKTVDSPYYAELSTKITLQYSQFQDFIAYQGVSMEEDNAKTVALKYDINTANQIDTSELENTDISLATQTIHLAWDNSLLEFDEFDRKVSEIFAIRTLMDVQNEYTDISKCKNTVIIDENNNIGHIYFDALAYSAYEIIFHKRIETSADENVWKDAEGNFLWDISAAPLDEGGIIYAETVKSTVSD
ncbi:MAG: hypothetical protein ACI4EN_06630 [Butyrivibrio sp.]